MSVLILKNVSTEGPGAIAEFLSAAGESFQIVELEREPLPSPDEFTSLVILGGPMSVNDTALYPYLLREEELVRKFIDQGRRVLGVCLGAQMMAKALGARVYPGAEKEIGWYDINLTDDALKDPAMGALAAEPSTGRTERSVKVFQWHGETFDLPAGAVHLADSSLFANQAFRMGEAAYAFQFHIEAQKKTIFEWLADEPIDQGRLKEETEAFHPACHARALNFFRSFFGRSR